MNNQINRMCILDYIAQYRSYDPEKGNILFMGDPLVGKSSIINRLTCVNKFNDKYLKTNTIRFVRYNYLTYIDYPGDLSNVDPIKFKKNIERLRSLKIDLIFIVYDVTNINSYKSIDKWKQKAYSEFGNNIHIILLGNKSDYWNIKVFEEHLLISAKENNGIFIEKQHYYSDSDFDC